MHRFVRLSLAALAAGCIAPSHVLACSGAYCAGDFRVALPAPALVPANLSELTIYGLGPYPFASNYDLRVWEASDPAHVLFVGKVTRGRQQSPFPVDMLSAGKHYVAEVTADCSIASEVKAKQIAFEVVAANEPPVDLGPLQLVHSGSGEVFWSSSSGGCYESSKEGVAEVELDPMHLPVAWRELVSDYQLMVDDQPFTWPITHGGYGPLEAARTFYFSKPGRFQAWTRCSPISDRVSIDMPRGLDPGRHTLWVRARVAGSTAKALESERREVELTCPGASSDAPRPDDRPAVDEPVDSASAPSVDPEAEDHSQSGTGSDAPEAATDGDGCSVSRAGQAPASGVGAAWTALLVALAARMRNSLRRQSSSRRLSRRT